jgi:hypothetical protein
MAKTFDAIDEHLERYLRNQPVYFVGTAPLDPDGHVNVSPKGGVGTFVVLGPRRVAYLDIAGSGAETIAHLRENSRIVIMFCAFEGRPRIVRLHGRGHVHQLEDPSFKELVGRFTDIDFKPEAMRSIIDVEVTRIADSCGYSVPLMSFEGWRDHRDLWVDKRLKQHGPDGVLKYMREKNLESLDGLPALDREQLES